MWLRKKTQIFPTCCTCCKLNPHDQLVRLCVYGIYKRPLRAPTNENILVLIAVDVGGKNTQEWNQVRIWAALPAGPEVSTVLLEGILGRSGGRWLPVWEKTDSSDSRKTFISLIFLTCSVHSFRFFFTFFFLSPPIPVVVVDFIGTMKSN